MCVNLYSVYSMGYGLTTSMTTVRTKLREHLKMHGHLLDDDDPAILRQNVMLSHRTLNPLEEKQFAAEELITPWIVACQLPFAAFENEESRKLCEFLYN